MQETPTEDLQVALAALRKTLQDEQVDLSAISLTGLSMGGYGSWDLASRYPSLFSAVVPICGGGDEKQAARLVGLPVWAWHGDADQTVPVGRSRAMVKAINSAGGSAKYTELEGVAHNSWSAAYGDEDLVRWLLTKRRPAAGYSECLDVLRPSSGAEKPVFVVFGDSITAAGDSPEGYLTLIRERMNTWPEDRRPQLINAGISGHRVPDLVARLERDVLSKKPTVVLIVIGINDVWHRRFGKGTKEEEFCDGLNGIIGKLKEQEARVVLATPPVIGERTDGANELDKPLDKFASLIREICEKQGLLLCDYRREFINHLTFVNVTQRPSGVLTNDGVHMNPAGYRLMAKHAAIAFQSALSK
jgi:lysophospholipase L1-like esterase